MCACVGEKWNYININEGMLMNPNKMWFTLNDRKKVLNVVIYTDIFYVLFDEVCA